MPKGEHKGAQCGLLFKNHYDSEPREAWAQFYTYFPVGFEAVDGGGKFAGWSANYAGLDAGIKPDGDDKWSARGMFKPAFNTTKDSFNPGDADPATVPIEFAYYVYHMNQDGDYGDAEEWKGDYQRGQWYKIDQYAKVNDVGSKNGILKAWVNDSLVYDRQDFEFRSTTSIDIRSHLTTAYYGGGWTSPVDNQIYYDNLAISTQGKIG